MNQLKQVVGKLKGDYRFNLKTDLFYQLMETCYYHSTYENAYSIYTMMDRYDVLPDNAIKFMMFEQRAASLKQQK